LSTSRFQDFFVVVLSGGDERKQSRSQTGAELQTEGGVTKNIAFDDTFTNFAKAILNGFNVSL
jgi:hypothetical protein